MEKLTIYHIKGYLGTGLKCLCYNKVWILCGYEIFSDIQIARIAKGLNCNDLKEWVKVTHIKPILKPMEMFDEDENQKYSNHIDLKYGLCKLIPEKDIEFFQKSEVLKYSLDKNELRAMVSYWEFKEYLYKNHYDIYGLIEKGLAEDWRKYDILR